MESPASMPAVYMASISTSNAGLAVTEDLTIRTYANRFAENRREQVAKCAAPKVPMAATVAIRGFG